MDWHTPQAFEVGRLYVDVDTDEVVEFVGRDEMDGLAELGVSTNVLVFRSVADGELRVATELGARRGEQFVGFVDEGMD